MVLVRAEGAGWEEAVNRTELLAMVSAILCGRCRAEGCDAATAVDRGELLVAEVERREMERARRDLEA
jgi:hypothetical protein